MKQKALMHTAPAIRQLQRALSPVTLPFQKFNGYALLFPQRRTVLNTAKPPERRSGGFLIIFLNPASDLHP